jgi:hypothetical protein
MSTTHPPRDASPNEHGEFEKRVGLLEKNDDEQTVTAAALVPDRLDHQGDFLREETIRDLADGYAERVANGDAYPGVMHAVFPSEGIELAESRVLDSAETVGEKDLPAGSWVQRYRITDDTLWSLVKEDVLSGVSIGGTAKGVIYEPGAIPDDVEIPDAVQAELDEADLDREDIYVREITDGRIMETSQVDMPAVPDAVHAEAKTLAKAAPALTENVVAARLYLEARGIDPDAARELAEYMDEHKSQKGLFGRLREKWTAAWSGGAATVSNSDEPAESGVGSDADTDTAILENMDEDELNEKFEALDSRLDSIDEKLSDEADGTGDGGDGTEKNTDGGADDGPTTEEKLDQLAEATGKTVEQVQQIAEQVERMASAQGVSQQADQGGSGGSGDEKLWGDNSPFGGGD